MDKQTGELLKIWDIITLAWLAECLALITLSWIWWGYPTGAICSTWRETVTDNPTTKSSCDLYLHQLMWKICVCVFALDSQQYCKEQCIFLGNCRKCNKMHRYNNSVQFHCLLIIIWTWPKSAHGQSYSPAADWLPQTVFVQSIVYTNYKQ